MTLPELRKLLDVLGMEIAYHQWGVGQVPDLPYILYYADEDNNFLADDTVYHDGYAVTIEVYSKEKNLLMEEKIKQLLKENQIPYKSYEKYLETENMYLKAYEINI